VQAANATINLTGTWVSLSDGALYYITQVGDEVWWYGESSSTSPFFANAARGTFDGTLALILNSVDVPKGATTSIGIFVIEVLDANDLSLVYATGGFRDSFWTRQ
jgi:hypothetical protein